MLQNLLRYFTCLVCGFTVCDLFSAEPVMIASGQKELAPKQPHAAVTSSGAVHLVYGVGDAVFHCRSEDEGLTFQQPREAFRVPNLSLGMRRGPRIAVTDDAVVVTAIGGKQGKGRDGDLQAWHSTDRGETWRGPVNVNDVHDSAREGLHGMAAGSDGSIWCVWLDLREKRTEVYVSKSEDGGATWQANIRVYRSPDGSVCECCHPSVAVSGHSVHVMFRNSLAGNRDLYLVSFSDHGKTFSLAKKLGRKTWELDACPMDGGMLASAPDGSLTTIWRRGKEIFTINDGDDQEQRLGHGEQPWIAMSPAGPLFVWTAGREGDLMLQKAGVKQPLRLATDARDAVIVSAPNGAEPVIACWESKSGGLSAVMAARIDLGK